MRRQSVEILILIQVTHTNLRAIRYQIDGLSELTERVVNLLDKVDFHVLVEIEVSVKDILYFLNIQVGIVLLEMLVVYTQADELGEKRARESRTNELSVGRAEGAL